MRVLHPTLLVAASLAGLMSVAGAEDLDTSRFYFGPRGGFGFLLDPKIAPGIEAKDGRTFGALLGVNLSPHLGVELGLDYFDFEKLMTGGQTIGEYSMFSLIPQLRLRYPLLDGRLSPYAVAGVGVLFTDFNDRKRPGVGLSVDATDTALVGTVGLGFDYFVADNIAVGLSGHWFGSSGPEIVIQGRSEEAEINALTMALNLRVLFPGAPPPPPAPSAPWPRRFYLQMRLGGAAPVQSEVARGLEPAPENSGFCSVFSQLFGIAIGMDVARYLSVELSSDGWEINVEKRGTGSISEFAVYTGMVVARVRYPVLDDRLIPFVLAGAGLAYGESNDVKPRGLALGVEGNTGFVPTGAIGVGVDYMVARNVALGFETKYVLVRDHELTSEGRTQKLNLDAVLTSVSLRIFFP